MIERDKISTVFFGAGNFAVKILENLLTLDYLDIKAVVTQPDKVAGRKKLLTFPPVKHFLQSEPIKLPLLQPEKLRTESAQILEDYKPELIIVADYGQMVPKDVIDYPKFKCLNIHGSILPKYRGAVPAAMAILNGDKTTGVSIPIMTYNLDDGAVIASKEIGILDVDTTYSLRMRLADAGNELIKEILPKWLKGEINPICQEESLASVTWESDIDKEKALIKLDTPISIVDRMIRAFSPWPIAWAKVDIDGVEKRLKIYRATKVDSSFTIDISNHSSGKIFKDNKKLYLTLQDGVLELQEIQLEGKKVLSGNEYLFLDGVMLHN
jgi:methionyl-tRNA formyltransferase